MSGPSSLPRRSSSARAIWPARSSSSIGGTPAFRCRSARARHVRPSVSSRRCPTVAPTPSSSHVAGRWPTSCRPWSAAFSASVACPRRRSPTTTPRSSPPARVGRARLHPEVAALFGGLRLKPVVLRPRRPTSKGQVERTIGYLETSFLPLRSFADLADLQTQHDACAATVAHRRSLRRTGARGRPLGGRARLPA